eukprot:3837206-Rhodomonas_salina.1
MDDGGGETRGTLCREHPHGVSKDALGRSKSPTVTAPVVATDGSLERLCHQLSFEPLIARFGAGAAELQQQT